MLHKAHTMRLRIAGLFFALVLLAGCGGGGAGGGSTPNVPVVPTATPSATPSATVNLSAWDSAAWVKHDGYGNGGAFAVAWCANHAVTQASNLVMTLDTNGCTANSVCPAGCAGQAYASAEMATSATYGYGTYTVAMQAAKGSGIVSTFFTYINTTPGGPETNDEIDVEIPGARTTTLEATYYKLGGAGVSTVIPLPFDASLAMHTYSIVWLPNAISWVVDGQTLYTANGSPATMPTTPSNLLLNFWAGNPPWLGAFTYTGPLQVLYGSASFTPAQ